MSAGEEIDSRRRSDLKCCGGRHAPKPKELEARGQVLLPIDSFGFVLASGVVQGERVRRNVVRTYEVAFGWLANSVGTDYPSPYL